MPSYIKTKRFTCIADILKLIKNTKISNFHAIYVCAAISDYTLKKQKGKISSDKNKLILEMQKAPKIISKIRKKAPKSKIIGFKIEDKTTKLKKKSYDILKTNNLEFVIGNTTSGFYKDENEIIIINKKGKNIHKKGKKENLTNIILDLTLKQK